MIKGFKNRRLKRLFERDNPSRLPAEDINKIKRILARLNTSGTPEEMDAPGFHLHPLKGDRKGEWSVTVRGNWRVTFKFEDGEACDVDYIDYH